jgi:hypothetical protein
LANSVAIGAGAGGIFQGANAVAIGYSAGGAQQAGNTIILNATGVAVNGNAGQENSCYIAPIRSITGTSTANQFYPVSYNPVTKELTIA